MVYTCIMKATFFFCLQQHENDWFGVAAVAILLFVFKMWVKTTAIAPISAVIVTMIMVADKVSHHSNNNELLGGSNNRT